MECGSCRVLKTPKYRFPYFLLDMFGQFIFQWELLTGNSIIGMLDKWTTEETKNRDFTNTTSVSK